MHAKTNCYIESLMIRSMPQSLLCIAFWLWFSHCWCRLAERIILDSLKKGCILVGYFLLSQWCSFMHAFYLPLTGMRRKKLIIFYVFWFWLLVMLMIWWLSDWVLFSCLMVWATSWVLTLMTREATSRFCSFFISLCVFDESMHNICILMMQMEMLAWFAGIRKAKRTRIEVSPHS